MPMSHPTQPYLLAKVYLTLCKIFSAHFAREIDWHGIDHTIFRARYPSKKSVMEAPMNIAAAPAGTQAADASHTAARKGWVVMSVVERIFRPWGKRGISHVAISSSSTSTQCAYCVRSHVIYCRAAMQEETDWVYALHTF
jgi:hypothetical protein